MKKRRNYSVHGEEGLLSIDFLVGFTIFMISFIMVVTMVSGFFIGLQSKTIDYDAVAYRTGVILAEDPGAAVSKVGVSQVAPDTFSWELIPDAYRDSHILRMGLALPKYYYDTPTNVWLENKEKTFFSDFASDDFYRNKLIFGDYPYRTNIALTTEGGESASIGEQTPDTGYYGYIKRVGLIKHPSSIDSNLDDNNNPDTLTDTSSQYGNDRVINYQFRNFYVRDPAYQVYPQIETTSVNFVNIPPMNDDPQINQIRVCYPCVDATDQAYLVVDGVKDTIPPYKLSKSSIVLMGGQDINGYTKDVWRSTDNGKSWPMPPTSADWSARVQHSSVVLPDRSVVLMGGNDGSLKNDVWRSTDNGVMWTRMNASAEWTARAAHSSVALPDGSIVLMGGNDGSLKNDVWRSTDKGKTWTQMKPNNAIGWTARASHTSVALPDSSIVLMGGNDGSLKNDVWRSTDNGASWMLMKPNNNAIGWSARASHSSVVLPDGSIVLMGGNDGSLKNDVWRSTDNGASWMLMNAGAGWSARSGHSSVVVLVPEAGIVLMGGQDGAGYTHDLWNSIDNGASWMLMNAGADWSARASHSSVAIPEGTNVLYIKPEVFQLIPNVGPISEFDIKLTFDTGEVRGLDQYDPLSQREISGTYRSVFHEPNLTPSWLEVKVW